jgi:hypothetical protein
MRDNPILREWYNTDVFNKIEQSFREENGMEHVGFLYQSFIEVVRRWQKNGRMRSDISAEMNMAIFSAMINATCTMKKSGSSSFRRLWSIWRHLS